MSKQEIKNSKRKFNTDEEEEEKWMNLSREEIIQRCKQLEKHVEQLKNTVRKTNGKELKTKSMRPFDFNKYSKRHIFLKFIYLGWDYHVRGN
jgi:hypothetical protein